MNWSVYYSTFSCFFSLKWAVERAAEMDGLKDGYLLRDARWILCFFVDCTCRYIRAMKNNWCTNYEVDWRNKLGINIVHQVGFHYTNVRWFRCFPVVEICSIVHVRLILYETRRLSKMMQWRRDHNGGVG